MKTEHMKACAFALVGEVAINYQSKIDEFKEIYGLNRCWMAIDSNGDVWLMTREPIFNKQPNIGVWRMDNIRGRSRRSVRIARVLMSHPGISEFAITEIVK